MAPALIETRDGLQYRSTSLALGDHIKEAESSTAFLKRPGSCVGMKIFRHISQNSFEVAETKEVRIPSLSTIDGILASQSIGFRNRRYYFGGLKYRTHP